MSKLYLRRCPECGLQNPGPAVATGQCSFCGYKANLGDLIDPRKGYVWMADDVKGQGLSRISDTQYNED